MARIEIQMRYLPTAAVSTSGAGREAADSR